MRKQTLAIALIATLASAGCATDEYGNSRSYTNAEKGAMMGAIGGAVVGAAVNHNNRGKGALIGAVGGGLAGGAVGHYMDTQQKDLQKVLAPEVSNGSIDIDKNPDNSLLVSMTSATAFDSGSYALKPGFYPVLDKIAKVLNTYGKTSLTIVGHTDNVGSDASNQTLSDRRADAVEAYLKTRNVAPQRLTSYGRGESSPRASNNTESGKALNRRVEILIVPVVQE